MYNKIIRAIFALLDELFEFLRESRIFTVSGLEFLSEKFKIVIQALIQLLLREFPFQHRYYFSLHLDVINLCKSFIHHN